MYLRWSGETQFMSRRDAAATLLLTCANDGRVKLWNLNRATQASVKGDNKSKRARVASKPEELDAEMPHGAAPRCSSLHISCNSFVPSNFVPFNVVPSNFVTS